MVASGKLAKYPLSILDKLHKVFPGAKLGGYDISCSHEKTIAKSSLGPKINIWFVIPLIHG
ncbi:hypothetical protein FRB95_002960, partial [Tulasnella sp. JGI-2019a]